MKIPKAKAVETMYLDSNRWASPNNPIVKLHTNHGGMSSFPLLHKFCTGARAQHSSVCLAEI